MLHGDCIELMPHIRRQFDMVFADPPYFLSNDGLTVKNGKITSVNKGKWDKSAGRTAVNDFNHRWLSAVCPLMKDNATIWISGTMHNIFSIGQLLPELGFKVLNIITWQKTNPPPNFSCRFFTHSTEQIIWARKEPKIPHYFNYDLMKQSNYNKQMQDVWRLPAIARWEKSCKKHPTQKPLPLLSRIILASTTGIAANLWKRNFLGIEQEIEYLDISKSRKKEIKQPNCANSYRQKIAKTINLPTEIE